MRTFRTSLVLALGFVMGTEACQQGPRPALTPVEGVVPARSDSFVVLEGRLVRVDVGQIARADTLTLPLFGADTVRPVRERTRRLAEGATYWYGTVPGAPGSSVTLVVKGRVVIGNIRVGERAYQIRYFRDDIHVLLRVDPRRYPAEGEPSTPPTARRDAETDPCPSDPPTDIDVMVLYSDDARVGAGGVDAMEATAILAMEETNQSYINSNITQRVRLVHLAEVAYAETGTSMTDRDALRSTTDGVLDNAHALRDAHGADLVILIVETLENCGRAFIMNPVSTAFETSGFAVTARSCAVGNYSFGHELGHVMSARHDWLADNTNNSPFAFNHGHIRPTPTAPTVAAWRTIMSLDTGCPTCTRVMFWSNPFVNFPVGGATTDPMGTNTGAQQTDNAQTLNTTAATVANFRCSSPSAANVWMKDTWNDTGAEPDPATAAEAMWRSPYIWVRSAQDAGLTHQHQHQDPEFGATNWVYVKLHNGAATAQSGTIELYYANASTSLAWPAAWTLIGSVAVTSMPAAGTRIVEQQWSSIPSTGHFCLLARWVSPTDPMATAEGTNIGSNVRANNNLAWKNVNVVDLTTDGAAEEDSLLVRNADARRAAPFSLVIGWNGDDRWPSFLPVGEVTVRLDDQLAGAWNRGGNRGSGFDRRENRLAISQRGARLDSLMLPAGAQGWLYLRMRRLATTPRADFWLEVIQTDGKTTTGGVTYEIRTDRVP